MARSTNKPKASATAKTVEQNGYEVVGVVPGLINSPAHGLVDLRNLDPVLSKKLAEDAGFRYLIKK